MSKFGILLEGSTPHGFASNISGLHGTADVAGRNIYSKSLVYRFDHHRPCHVSFFEGSVQYMQYCKWSSILWLGRTMTLGWDADDSISVVVGELQIGVGPRFLLGPGVNMAIKTRQRIIQCRPLLLRTIFSNICKKIKYA